MRCRRSGQCGTKRTDARQQQLDAPTLHDRGIAHRAAHLVAERHSVGVRQGQRRREALESHLPCVASHEKTLMVRSRCMLGWTLFRACRPYQTLMLRPLRLSADWEPVPVSSEHFSMAHLTRPATRLFEQWCGCRGAASTSRGWCSTSLDISPISAR
jgi:hypothetical protein